MKLLGPAPVSYDSEVDRMMAELLDGLVDTGSERLPLPQDITGEIKSDPAVDLALQSLIEEKKCAPEQLWLFPDYLSQSYVRFPCIENAFPDMNSSVLEKKCSSPPDFDGQRHSAPSKDFAISAATDENLELCKEPAVKPPRQVDKMLGRTSQSQGKGCFARPSHGTLISRTVARYLAVAAIGLFSFQPEYLRTGSDLSSTVKTASSVSSIESPVAGPADRLGESPMESIDSIVNGPEVKSVRPADIVLQNNEASRGLPSPSIQIVPAVNAYSFLQKKDDAYLRGLGDGKREHLIVVDKDAQKAVVYELSLRKIDETRVSTGKVAGDKKREGDLKTPNGLFQIVSREKSTSWKYDGQAGAYGDFFSRTNAGSWDNAGKYDPFALSSIGIHGTNEPEKIGTRASHGCVRLPNEKNNDYVQSGILGVGTIIGIIGDKTAEDSKAVKGGGLNGN